MTTQQQAPQKTADPSPYASLRGPRAPAQAGNVESGSPIAPDSQGFAAELEKLEELREALWQAFKAGPDAGLPTLLIELTNCYTNTLRFQMNMKSLNARKGSPNRAELMPREK